MGAIVCWTRALSSSSLKFLVGDGDGERVDDNEVWLLFDSRKCLGLLLPACSPWWFECTCSLYQTPRKIPEGQEALRCSYPQDAADLPVFIIPYAPRGLDAGVPYLKACCQARPGKNAIRKKVGRRFEARPAWGSVDKEGGSMAIPWAVEIVFLGHVESPFPACQVCTVIDG